MEYRELIPQFDSILDAFKRGKQLNDLSLCIQYTFMTVIETENQWKLVDTNYTIGRIKFDMLQTIWQTLLSEAFVNIGRDSLPMVYTKSFLQEQANALKKDEQLRANLRQQLSKPFQTT